MHFEKSIFFRILVAVLLAGGALGLFLTNRAAHTPLPPQTRENITRTLQQVDTEVDTLLARSCIQREWIKKQQVEIQNSTFTRTERRVSIPPDIIAVQINVACNTMMKRFGGLAVGTEDLKESTVTIHLKIQSQIIQTIVLKVSRELKTNIKQARA